MRFSKDILRVGDYHIGGGLFHKVTQADVHQYAQSFAAMRAAGVEVPIPWEHPPLDKGMPELSDSYERRATETKHNAGWLESMRVDGDTLVAEIDVPNKADAEAIREGRIRGVSPRLMNGKWKDGLGREWERFVAHVALTNRPRDTRQGRFQAIDHSESTQSGIRAVDVFMADDEQKPFPKKGDGESDEGSADASKPTEKPANPDMPNGGDSGERQQMEALIANLKECGLALPADTDASTIVERLLTASMTYLAAKKANQSSEQPADDAKLQEQSAMQFSDSPLFKEFVKLKREGIVVKIKTAKMTPAARTELLKRAESVQLSDVGNESASMTLAEVAELLDSTSGGLDGLSQNLAELSEHESALGKTATALADGSTATADQERAAVREMTKHERR